MPFRFTINPYRGCTHACVSYCFARPTHTYLDFNAARGLRARDSRQGQRARARARRARPADAGSGDHVALGTNTDPYQWVEGRYRLMQGIWEAMRDSANPCSVLTKSPLCCAISSCSREIAEAHRFLDRSLGPDARREGVARDRAPHAAPAQAPRGGRRADARRDRVQRLSRR